MVAGWNGFVETQSSVIINEVKLNYYFSNVEMLHMHIKTKVQYMKSFNPRITCFMVKTLVALFAEFQREREAWLTIGFFRYALKKIV